MASDTHGKQKGRTARKRRKKKPDLQTLIREVKAGNRTALAQAITLVESRLEADAPMARELAEACFTSGEKSLRIGITGVPGAGKSTFIEQLGLQFLAEEKRVAVLAVDPSSSLSKGSILGDKTRMQALGRAENAFIRPSPAGDSLGGVARKTRESISLCEAAGFDVILVETVGVGQSETAVHSMVDFFLLLKIAGAGDELQGIKRGIVEMADALVINKADGANLEAARRAQTTFQNALHLYPPKPDGWTPEVLLCSATEGHGIAEIRALVARFREEGIQSGSLQAKRKRQNLHWMKRTVEAQLKARFFDDPRVRERYGALEKAVAEGRISPFRAADELLSLV